MQTVWKLFQNPKIGLFRNALSWIMRRVPISIRKLPNPIGMEAKQVVESFKHISQIDIKVASPVPSPKPYGYRSKLTPH